GYRLLQGIKDPCFSPNHGGLSDAKPFGDEIGRFKADAHNVTGKTVRIFRDQWNRIRTVGLVNADRPRSANPMTLQEGHDLANYLLIGPAGGDPRRTLGTNALDLKQSLRLSLDHVEYRFAEGYHQPVSEGRTDSLDETRSQIPCHPFS